MQLIEALTECTESIATARACIPLDHFVTADGAVPESILVECMAQTVAAALGYRTKLLREQSPECPTPPPATGMLAAVSNFRFESRLPAGKPIDITVRNVKRLGPMLMVSGTISSEGQLIASGELSLYA